jgi:hypothetical protein
MQLFEGCWYLSVGFAGRGVNWRGPWLDSRTCSIPPILECSFLWSFTLFPLNGLLAEMAFMAHYFKKNKDESMYCQRFRYTIPFCYSFGKAETRTCFIRAGNWLAPTSREFVTQNQMEEDLLHRVTEGWQQETSTLGKTWLWMALAIGNTTSEVVDSPRSAMLLHVYVESTYVVRAPIGNDE